MSMPSAFLSHAINQYVPPTVFLKGSALDPAWGGASDWLVQVGLNNQGQSMLASINKACTPKLKSPKLIM
jgi:hypothetical protein